jgi:hypothetical protein
MLEPLGLPALRRLDRGQCQKIDHGVAGRAGRDSGRQNLEGSAIGLLREELVTIDQPHQRHRFTPQRMDQVVIVDDVTMGSSGVDTAARQGHLQDTPR